ncbi:ral guanine nucleotide dissociation stimulator-like 1 isoform X3 [Sitodiplosis mosellana]|uniref:ral guanine nucleotide dissociation stimulator-like 1 isoform X3 n=1 Tax=Sitodiplosis mosellana TaxID=263140 RepID=UPI00244487D1|nr:ral guanine nucleotide dissociation stimulator-like 1 isoform X3 [Sitodiplosis mosellana]XP_055314239.1 ral guanine nucleotide dissociation stimulator-like 1 isoform X3 [Sitodiplosis mosellana]XP_055314240.1 ral guanine nucleotide dissociation stimulator-like 1 isoform X3 [Sitodiplosis mosellana]XP_055314241.1 ral guanine nucleotide dissociation stimulator-like 1 isoform X3 [Sitodiplosis mosellana]XP_055314242.1 ral guanine nucleotide dissociation stimulator-like 1 isoform X3 [Sitodiplosis m
MTQNAAESLQPTWRLWGEEREKDVIFTVYLKKVRYHRPTPSASSDSDDEISHLEWETVRVRFVKAATLTRLVEALSTDDGELESTFVNVFLATYRTFARTEQVIELLLQRYERLHAEPLGAESFAEQHKKSLVAALHVWLDGYPEDWNVSNLKKIIAFTSKRLSSSEVHHKALNRLERLARARVAVPSATPWDHDYSTDFAQQFNGLCLTPAFMPPSHLLQAYRFPHISVKHFAEQLTRMDMELFKRLIPHQCLGATWSRRDKNEANTVLATVTQFNAVSFRVISSILIEPKLRPQERAIIISTWIDIAQELRILKNFSSLKAIISGLQSNAIYRLSKTWAALPREKLEIFNELARIFSEDNNAWAQREVLMREGTAKFADTTGENDRHLQKVFQKQDTHISHGTIPYLGTFLTDLTMIHAAIPDTIGPNNLINFDKKRKEFEVLAQIKLLQGAANAYHLPEDLLFDRWFASLLVLDEREAHTLSCQLEPPPPSSDNKRSQISGSGHKKSDSIASNSSSGAGSQFYCEIGQSNDLSFSRHNSLGRDMTPPNASIMSATSSVSSLSMDSSSSGQNKAMSTSTYQLPNNHSSNANNTTSREQIDSRQPPPPSAHARGDHYQALGKSIQANAIYNTPASLNNSTSSNSSGHYNQPMPPHQQNSPHKNPSPDFYIIRVTYETDNVELDGIVLYKSIMLGNNERTPHVIKNSMLKLGLDGDPDRYTLAQVLPDKELIMPPNANVYYAVNTAYNLNFILRPKRNTGI